MGRVAGGCYPIHRLRFEGPPSRRPFFLSLNGNGGVQGKVGGRQAVKRQAPAYVVLQFGAYAGRVHCRLMGARTAVSE